MRVKKVWADPVSLATTPGIIIYFLFLNLLRCFSSVGSLLISYFIQLPETFRSLPRPSSVLYV
jgi:hypothetical protein